MVDQLNAHQSDVSTISGIVKEIDGSHVTLTTNEGEMLANLASISNKMETIRIFDRVEFVGEKIGNEFQVSEFGGSSKADPDGSLSPQDALAPTADKMLGTS